MSGACRGHKRVPYALELKLQVVVHHHVSAGNQKSSSVLHHWNVTPAHFVSFLDYGTSWLPEYNAKLKMNAGREFHALYLILWKSNKFCKIEYVKTVGF